MLGFEPSTHNCFSNVRPLAAMYIRPWTAMGREVTRGQGDAPPPGPGHERVVEDMEKRDLALLLPQDKE